MSEGTNTSLVEKLFKSFEDLESAISGARASLEKKASVPKHIFQRLDSYDEILKKQRQLALTLTRYVVSGDTAEVARYVTIINSLSGMIIEDARSILGSLGDQNTPTSATASDDDLNFC